MSDSPELWNLAGYPPGYLPGLYQQTIDALKAENARLKQSLPQWTSVKDRLPKKDGEYLVYLKWLNPANEWVSERMLWDFKDGKWEKDEDTIVTHWMEMPPLPKESEE